jgi:peptide/nickel transport system permease protein
MMAAGGVLAPPDPLAPVDETRTRFSRLRAFRARHPLVAVAVQRVLAGVVILFLVSILVFAATQILPGNAAVQILGRNATPQAVSQLSAELGLNRSALHQYTSWLVGLLHGNLGHSLAAHEPVSEFIGDRIRNTLILAGVAVLLMVPLGIVLGVLAGVKKDRLPDHAITGFTLGAIALPEFVSGALLALIFAGWLALLPPVSLVSPGSSPLSHPNVLVLPVATLLLAGTAYIVRMMRAGVITVMGSEYVEAARLNGIGERRIIWKHALRNALAPTVQVLALTVQWLVGGVVVTETIFSYPGLGQGLVQAVQLRDLPVVQAIAILFAALYIAINIVADLLVVMLIPKLRTGA